MDAEEPMMVRKPQTDEQHGIFEAFRQLRSGNFLIENIVALAKQDTEYTALVVRPWVRDIRHKLDIDRERMSPLEIETATEAIRRFLEVDWQTLGVDDFVNAWLLDISIGHGSEVGHFLLRKLEEESSSFSNDLLRKIRNEGRVAVLTQRVEGILGDRAARQAAALLNDTNLAEAPLERLEQGIPDTARPAATEVPEKSNESYVFLSYVRDNDVDAERFAIDLKEEGIRVWKDQEKLQPGQHWKKEIREAISDGGFFIALFSKESVSRDRSYQNEELVLAIEELRKRSTERTWFIPVKLNDCEIPNRDIGGGKTLADLHFCELFPNWKAGVAAVVKTILKDVAK